ncbi:MAG TPA: ribonuclease III [Symbiobacteriaceae bacterium]|nr:ribonuclease III [Symbiobacteriaceae bacterium]
MQEKLQDWTRENLGHAFKNPRLLLEAITHTTFANENPGAPSNQRLEFLGDSVVGMVTAQYIFQTFQDLPEGELTKIRAAVVCEPTLAARARALGVGPLLRFGKGEAVSGRDRDSILADAFEALVGAIFLDGGLEAARSFVLRELAPLVAPARSGLVRVDYKTRLQELLQNRFTEGPAYRLLAEEGPAHERRFQVAVWHREAELGRGWGRSKKEAEQEAARQALEALG